MTTKKKKPYRVFVTRNYIAVEFFDVVAETKQRAKTMAERAARKVSPDPRETAVDNGWISEQPVELERLGLSAAGENPLIEILPGIFQFKK